MLQLFSVPKSRLSESWLLKDWKRRLFGRGEIWEVYVRFYPRTSGFQTYRDIKVTLLLNIGFTSSRVPKIWQLPIEQGGTDLPHPTWLQCDRHWVMDSTWHGSEGIPWCGCVNVGYKTSSSYWGKYRFLSGLGSILSNEWSSAWNQMLYLTKLEKDWENLWKKKIVRNYDLAHRYSKKVGPILPELSLHSLFWMWAQERRRQGFCWPSIRLVLLSSFLIKQQGWESSSRNLPVAKPSGQWNLGPSSEGRKGGKEEKIVKSILEVSQYFDLARVS